MIEFDKLKQDKHDRELLVKTALSFYHKQKRMFNLITEYDIEILFDLSFWNHTETFGYYSLKQIFQFSNSFKKSLLTNDILPETTKNHCNKIHGAIHLKLLDERAKLNKDRRDIKKFLKIITLPELPK